MSKSALSLLTLGLALLSGSAPAAESRSVWLVGLEEPAAVAFEGPEQLSAGKRVAGLEALAPHVTGARRFDAKSAAARRYVDFLHQRQDQVLAEAKSRLGRELSVLHRYDLVANGFAIALSDSEAKQLRQVPGVLAVVKDRVFWPQTDAGPDWIEADQVWNGTVVGSTIHTRGEGVVVGIIDSGIATNHVAFADVSSDGYNHSNPRGVRYGLCNNNGETRCNDKLIGLYDFVNENCTGQTNTPKGNDCNGHGTHVAGTAAGGPFSVTQTGRTTNAVRALTGVAPRANIVSYKVCSQSNGCAGSASVSALNQAAADGVDVVNYSIGGPEYTPWYGIDTGAPDPMTAFLNLRNAGVVPVSSAGNNGPNEGTMSSPGNAPWIIAVANAVSGRRAFNQVSDVNGHGITTPIDFDGVGFTSGVSEAQIVHAKDFGNALCGTGTATNNTTSCTTSTSNPFAAGSLAGKIVICDRGNYARVEKGCNVKLAGAVGMILANVPGGDANLVGDDHFLPAVHIDADTGTSLKALVEAARVASAQVRGSISGYQARNDGRGDILNVSSSRGPTQAYDGVMKPNITAPGTSIAAPANNSTGGAVELTGTSMASPHVAGAAALLLAGNPGWTVSQVESALLGTANHRVLIEDGVTAARYTEGGVGRVDLSQAPRAGLFFNVTDADYRAANPSLSGSAKNLNLPFIHTQECVETCAFVRQATASVAGNWRVEVTAPAQAIINVAPTQFGLAAGASQSISVSADVRSDQLIGSWVEGEIRLISDDPNVATMVLPISIFSSPGDLPDEIYIETNSTSGLRQIDFSGMAAFNDLTFDETSLAEPVRTAQQISIDSTASDPYDNNVGAFTVLIAPPSGGVGTSTLLQASLDGASSGDIDLFVGFDADADGLADPEEELCKSISSSSLERCVLDATFPSSTSRYWARVQQLSAFTAQVPVFTTVNVFDSGNDLGFTVSGPRKLSSGATFGVRLGWNLPALDVGETAVGYARLGARRDRPGSAGVIPVRIKRVGSSDPAPIILNGLGDSETITLAGNSAHERIIIDVPPNATGLHVATSGSGEVDLYLAKSSAALTPPNFAAAPARGSAQGSSIHAGATEQIDLTGVNLSPGRWYVTPVNTGATAATITLTASLDFGSTPTKPGVRGYYNPDRGGSAIMLWEIGSAMAVAWYTYLEDGTPTWYTAFGPGPTGNAGVWRAPFYRHSMGPSQHLDTVGEVIITFNSESQFTFSWLLEGVYGSEPFQAFPTALRSCPNINGSPLSLTGVWSDAGIPGWGFSTDVGSIADGEVAYVFDGRGMARWVLGAAVPPGANVSMAMDQYTGFCPTCTRSGPPTAQSAGTFSRSYTSSSASTATLNLSFVSPVPGTWTSTGPQIKVNADTACQ